MIWIRSLAIILLSATLFARGGITLDEAFKRRLEIDPELKSLKFEQRSLESEKQAAGGIPPLELNMAGENLGRDELEISASQSFEIGDTRKKRKEVLAVRQRISTQAKLLRELEIHTELNTYLVEYVSFKRLGSMADKRQSAMEQILNWQKQRLDAGAISETEVIRSEIELERLRIMYKSLHMKSENILAEAANFLQLQQDQLPSPSDYPEFPEYDKITQYLNENNTSHSTRIQSENIALSLAELDESDLPIIPAVTVSGGIKNIPGSEAATVPIVGIGLEIPLFSRNAKTVEAQQYKVKSAKYNLESANELLDLQKQRWEQNWSLITEELKCVENDVLPKAERLYQQTYSEYQMGARVFLDVIDALTLLYDQEEQIINLEKELAQQLLELNNIFGDYFYEFK